MLIRVTRRLFKALYLLISLAFLLALASRLWPQTRPYTWLPVTILTLSLIVGLYLYRYQWRCPYCQRNLGPTFKYYCTHCGKKVKEDTILPPGPADPLDDEEDDDDEDFAA
jgi:DNA-directed RNA polymerase subunit RPC12/RpoP